MALPVDLSNILALSVPERIEVLEVIWDSLDDPDPVEIPQWHRDELARRMENYRADPNAGSSWEEVQVRLSSDSSASR